MSQSTKKRKSILLIAIIVFIGSICFLSLGGITYWSLHNLDFGTTIEKISSSMDYMGNLQKELNKTYNAEKIEVELENGHILIVTFINSEANFLLKNEQIDKAEEISVFVKNHYGGIDNIDTIRISFIQEIRTPGITLNFSDTENTYEYYVKNLP